MDRHMVKNLDGFERSPLYGHDNLAARAKLRRQKAANRTTDNDPWYCILQPVFHVSKPHHIQSVFDLSRSAYRFALASANGPAKMATAIPPSPSQS
jgi:hypothetical protein